MPAHILFHNSAKEYLPQVAGLKAKADEVYRYMNFDQIPAFADVANV